VERIPLAEGPGGTSLAEGRWIVNPGAVGQPRDRDPRAACAVFDAGSAVLEWARVPYDVEAAQEAIRRSGMPDFEARRLAVGM
jgi:diadenosine tetraphosphatase ApaH/serine/threonine PP2A family protein phosphatase